jgi:class 3 adenylate cyclase/tetratricopeptide (TPR) repeat protein
MVAQQPLPTIPEWLSSLGMSEYVQRFEENRIDISILRDLTDEDLKAVGVVLGDRRRMLRAIAELTIASAKAPKIAAGAPGLRDTAERRYLTVLYCDLIGSTDLATRRDPEDVTGVISRYLGVVSATISRFGGHAERLLGDGVLVYFGWPRAHEDQVERAVAAGLEIVREVGRLEVEPGAALSCRIGIATGSVVVGQIFSDSRLWQTAVGTAPNLAARLQAVAPSQGVVIDAATHKELGDNFLVEPLPLLELKGFPEPLRAWYVLAARQRESRFMARGAQTMIGRDCELALLLDRWRRARQGGGQVILLCGEPGIGKSRLLEVLVERINPPPGACLRYQCAPLHSDTPLYPILQQMSRALGFETEDAPALRQEKLMAALGPYFPDEPDAIARFAALFALPGAKTEAAESPAVQRQRTIAGLVDLLLHLASRQPIIVLCEDIQWVDPTTEQAFRLAIERIVQVPLLLIMASREPFDRNWFAGSHVGAITLVRLDREESARLVHATASEPLDELTVQRIAERGDGIPLFLEEMTKCVVEERSTPARFSEQRPADGASLPTSLQASLCSRLDHLEEAKWTAQVGAAIGREFPVVLLADVLEQDPLELGVDLDRLVRSGLVAQRGGGNNASLWYKHALVHEAAYSSLLLAERKRLHARILDGYERLFPGRLEPMAQVLAQHATQSERWDKAAHYLGLAYSNAVSRSANREAINIFNRAIEALGRLPQEVSAIRAIDLRLHAFAAFHTVGDNDKLVELIGEAERLAELIGDRRRLAAAATQSAFALWLDGKHVDAQVRAEAALAAAELPKDFPIAVSALFNLANIRHAQGEIVQAVGLYRRVLTMLSGEFGTKRMGWVAQPGVVARAFASWYLLELGEFAEAAELLDTAERLITAAEPHGRVMVDTGRGNFLMRRGEYARAAEVLRASLELCRRAEVLTMLPMVVAWLGHSLCGAGRSEEAFAVLSDAVERKTYKFGGKYTWTHLRLALAEACRLTGKFEQAASEAELARRIAEDCGEVVHCAYVILEQGRIALARGEPEAALRRVESAVAIARSHGLRPFAAECLIAQAQAKHALQKSDASAAALAEARAIYAALGLDERIFIAPTVCAA